MKSVHANCMNAFLFPNIFLLNKAFICEASNGVSTDRSDYKLKIAIVVSEPRVRSVEIAGP